MNGLAYYNENDPFAAQWLRNLIAAGHIAPGDVDERSIVDVKPGDLDGYVQCHFFAGIGGWSYALRLAGWPDDRPVWTGSCPCQPFSEAGHGRGFEDPRHLWPEFYRLIRECAPATIFGEQTPKAKLWVEAVCSDLERLGYAVGAAILPAASVGAPHKRERLWFVANPYSEHEHRSGTTRAPGRHEPSDCREGFPHTDGKSMGRLAEPRRQCGDWSVEPDVGRVADGIPARVGRLRGLGNAIVPQVAAQFIIAASEALP